MSTTSGQPSQEDRKERSRDAPSSPTPSDLRSAHREEVTSQISRRTGGSRSTRSSAESAILRARAKAEAAKVKLEFAKKEAELRQQTARQEAALLLLNAERDAAVAEAEASVLEEDDGSRKSVNFDLPQEDYKDRIDQFLSSNCNGSEEVSFPMKTEVIEPQTLPNAPVVQEPPVKLASPQMVDTINVISEVSNMLLKKELLPVVLEHSMIFQVVTGPGDLPSSNL